MILQALCEYYQRREANRSSALAPFGFEDKGIPFLIVINRHGQFIRFEDTRDKTGKKLLPRIFVVAKGVKKTSGVAANLLWDPADYILGLDIKGNPQRTALQKQSFIDKILTLPEETLSDEGIAAVLQFYQADTDFSNDPLWPEIQKTNPVLTFCLLEDDGDIVFNRPAVMAGYRQTLNQQGEDLRRCLVTGELAPLALLHPAIKGVWGAQTAGANLVSFNQDAFRSWGKEQGANSPISERAAFEYTTALNALLQTNSSNRMQMGDTSVVCWAEKETPLETLVPAMFSDSPKDSPDKHTQAVTTFMTSLHSSVYHGKEGNSRFYMLGLAPNAARLSVRFWHVSTVADFSQRLWQWLDDINIAGARNPDSRPPLKTLLRSTALLGKDDNLSPHLMGETIRAIVSGQLLPRALLNAVLMRIKAESGRVNDYRAALIKAWLNRHYRKEHQEEITVGLNKEDKRVGYVLGRLFAVLEKTQLDASPGIKATISDRYYSRASSTPVTVFPTLIRLNQHHLNKLDKPEYRQAARNRLEEIVGLLDDYPAHLNLIEQANFSLGYYHQRQALYTKKLSTQGETA